MQESREEGAVLSRSGGPFPDPVGQDGREALEAARLREAGEEYGATTGRPRRCGWLDLPALRYAARINGLDALVVTKLDVLDGFDEIRAVAGSPPVSGGEITAVVLSDGVRAGVVRQDVDLDAAALLLFGMIQGLVNMWALNAYKFDLVKRYSDLWGVCRRSLAY